MLTRIAVVCVLAGGLTSVAGAGTIRVSDIGGGINLNSGPLSPGVFGNDQTNWTDASLIAANNALSASGIATNGKVTFFAGDTTHGLALLALVDQTVAQRGGIELGHLAMTTSAHGDNLAYINALDGAVVVGPNNPVSRTAQGTFVWNFHGAGNGFAWANLEEGNTMTYRFNKIPEQTLGLMEPSTFQFATWNGNGWGVVPVSTSQLTFTSSGDWGFSSFVVSTIPLPGGAAMAGASLVGLAMLRRRR